MQKPDFRVSGKKMRECAANTGFLMLSRRSLLGLSLMTLATTNRAGAMESKFRHYDGPPITQMQVYKARRRLYLFSEQKVVKSYRVALGRNPVGPKRWEGDGRTPEGTYFIDWRNPKSEYHLSLRISYPNPIDLAESTALGLNPGGDIFIHGRADKHKGLGRDWTVGCIAVRDNEIEEIYAMVPNGTVIFIFA
jgi:murein L,D-transpeptidase YafK